MNTKQLLSLCLAPRKLLAGLLIFCTASISQGQIVYQSLIGGAGNDVAWSVTTSWYKNLIFAGYTESWGAGGRDILACQLYSDGTVDWAMAIGTALNEECHCIIRTSDRGYLLAGSIQTTSNSTDALVLKLSSTGIVEWAKRFGGTGADYASHVIETDSSFFVTGNSGSYGGSYTDIFLISLKKTGSMRFSKIYGGTNHDSGVDLMEADNGNIILTGGTRSYQGSSYLHDIYWMEADTAGNPINMHIFGDWNVDGGFSITKAIDSGYILTGYTTNPSTYDEDILVVKLTAAGNLQWASRYGGTGYDGGTRVLQNYAGNGYILFGYTQSLGMGNSDVFMMDLNSDGSVDWAKAIGSSYEEGFAFKHNTHLGISKTNDGTYAFADYSTGFNGSGLKDAYCGIIDESGWTCGNTMNITMPMNSLSLHEYAVTITGTLVYDSASVSLTSTPLTLIADSICYGNISGFEQLVEEKSITLFPNPAQESVSISLPSTEGEVRIMIFSTDGRLVKNEIFQNSGNSYLIDLKGIKSGCYYMNITNGANTVVKKLLISK